MSRLSFRPRPLDIHKKLPIIKSVKDFDDDEVPTAAAATRNSQLLRIAAETDNEVHHITVKKVSSEIPTPQYNIVETYERDYSRTFSQPSSYLRGRGARAEISEFVEYDLDNEDEDWLQNLNNERRILPPEKFECLLFKLEVLDHKIRERSGGLQPTFTDPVPVLLQLDAAAEPPPPVNDTNPYNVFRPREKAHRLHTRRVRRNLGQAKTVLEALIKNEAQLVDDGMAMIGFQSNSQKFGSSEDDFIDSDDARTGRPRVRAARSSPFAEPKILVIPRSHMKRGRALPHRWSYRRDAHEPVLLFTRPLDPDKLAAAGIVPPSSSPVENGSKPTCRFHGRIGRGGRIVFDRWNPLLQSPIGFESIQQVPANDQPPQPNG
ncbi:hypothetical protein KFK09_014945 [Dendrobium nobile]|uniref:Enhancer of polycomb-like protein n=1 Tax=Dendrobium nobile TaxID=94219 RepID=A0A8T3B4H9_DENNO|nr:hypothetical protein KFK09_014945 [Dendrobium nobile]